MARSTLAILFSDIEGSTRLLQMLGPGYVDLLLEHRRLMREAFDAHHGTERGLEGDSFFMTFPTAADAVAAALDAQLALQAKRWEHDVGAVRVRMGVHVGGVELLDDMVFGMAVHETARLSAAAHGGQVLVSGTAQQLADPMPVSVGWVDLGRQPLKDVPAPMHILQLTHPELPSDFPPPRVQGGVRKDLPQQSSSFIGREAEVEQVRSLLKESRLVTLTGTGGVGKTRIALRVAADPVERFSDGVVLVDLAPIGEPDAVLPAVAAATGSPAATSRELALDLRDRDVLLLIDNCEHVLDTVSFLVDEVQRGTTGVTVLATSREPLGVAGEVVWRVPPLSERDARALLSARAHAVNGEFAITDDNVRAVDDVCRRLDAIPLALELAAARMTSLSVEQVAQRLDQRFRLLAGGTRGTLERHRTLQATVDWSYDHLKPPEQALLCRLGVFTGGFTLDAAEAVAGDADPITVLDILDSLVVKSLVVADQRNGAVRYRLLETIRQYALDRLGVSANASDARDAHLEWVLSLCLPVRELWHSGSDPHWLTRIDDEQGNLRAAFEWARGGVPVKAVSILLSALPWIIARGRSREWLEPSQSLLEQDLTGTGRATAQVLLLWLTSNTGPIPAELIASSQAAAVVLDGQDPAWLGPTTRAYLAAWSYPSGDRVAAEAAIPECLAAVSSGAALPIGVRPMLIQPLIWVYLDAGRLDAARATADEALAAAVTSGVSFMESRMALNRARVDLAAGDRTSAAEYANQAVTVARSTGDTFVATTAIRLIARIEEDEGHYETARDLLAGVLDDVAETQSRKLLAEVREDFQRCSRLADVAPR